MAKAIEDAIAALQYKDANYIKIEVPFKLTVKKTGEMDPGQKTFKFAIDRFGAPTVYTLVQDTVETNGEKTYEGKFIFTISRDQAGNLSEGFVIHQVKGNAALESIDFGELIALIDSGVIGKLVEVESADGDIVEITVE